MADIATAARDVARRTRAVATRLANAVAAPSLRRFALAAMADAAVDHGPGARFLPQPGRRHGSIAIIDTKRGSVQALLRDGALFAQWIGGKGTPCPTRRSRPAIAPRSARRCVGGAREASSTNAGRTPVPTTC